MIDKATRFLLSKEDRAIYDDAPPMAKWAARWTLFGWVGLALLIWAVIGWTWQPLVAYAVMQVAAIVGGWFWLTYGFKVRRAQRAARESGGGG